MLVWLKYCKNMVNSNSDFKYTPAEIAILTTIIYSDIFSFPLSAKELWKFLIYENRITHEEFNNGLSILKQLTFKDGYYALKSRERIISKRKKNLSEVTKKIRLAQKIAQKLSVIPSVLFIGISGGLAAGNANSRDDIDIMIIVKKNTLFTSRVLILILLEIFGVRRFRKQKDTADTICVNLIFDETEIEWFKDKKDVYTAREIAQIIPLFEKNNMYGRFFNANLWIRQFLPNISYTKLTSLPQKRSHNTYLFNFDNILFVKFFKLLLFNSLTESFLRFLQMSFMKGHQSNEIITNHFLAFHPFNYRIFVLEKLRLKMRQLGLLTNF